MKKIIVYSKANCMQCTFTKKFLSDKHVNFEVKEVDQSDDALQEVRSLGFQSLPVIVAEGLEPFHGFRPDLLEKLV